MKHSLIALLIAAISALGTYAQDTEGSKILVFRNTGEITIFNSDSIAKVELSVFDSDSIAHDEFISQVFHYKNSSSVAIPIAEIDSVAFGYRNIIEPKKGVRRLTDEEAEAISSFNGETIIYDSRLSLAPGETIYYDRITENLPLGLCAKVGIVADESNGHKATVTVCNPKDIFDRYLMTGDSSSDIITSRKKAEGYDNEILKLSLPEYENGGVKVDGYIELTFRAELANVVRDVVNDYFHADIRLSASPKLEFNVTSDDSGGFNLDLPENIKPRVSFPFLWGAFNLGVTFDAFLDFMAEAGISYELEQDHAIVIEWTRNKGKNTFGKPTIESQQLNEATQKIEAHLNGELFLGPKFDISLNMAMDIAGVGIELKAGPKLEGEFSLGLISQLAEKYDEEAYGKANIYIKGGAKLETYESHRTWKNPKLFEKNKLPFEAEAFIDFYTLNLFPEFHSKAVLGRATAPIVQTGKEPEAISVSSFTETQLPYPLDISFEIADKNTDETLAETEVTSTLEKDQKDYQTVFGEVILPSTLGKIEKDAIVARPVINYKGHKIKAAPVNASGDMIMTPNICSLTGRSAYFVSGMTPVSQHTFGETTYIEGNLVGYGVKCDPRYKKRKFKMYELIDLSEPNKCTGSHGSSYSLLADWKGIIAKEEVLFTFAEGGKGYYNNMPFTYKCNSPQKGWISIQLSDGSRISFSVVDISDDTLTIIMKGSDEEIILSRQ